MLFAERTELRLPDEETLSTVCLPIQHPAPSTQRSAPRTAHPSPITLSYPHALGSLPVLIPMAGAGAGSEPPGCAGAASTVHATVPLRLEG